MYLRLSLTAILFTLSLAASTASAQSGAIELTAGFYRIEAEVAADQSTRMVGLMNRRQMPAHQGMLFVFPFNERHCMWMKNTLIPLSVAFIDESGRILNIADMLPQTENNHCAAAPARYALEMNRGWFSGKGIKAGQRIDGLDKAPQPR